MNPPVSTLLVEKGRKILSVPPTATVGDAVRLMNHHKVGSVVVLDGDTLVGIFTERDVLYRVVAAGLTPALTSIHQVMTRNPRTITADVSIQDALQLISEKRCRHLPVLEDGRLVGLISQGDITRWLVHAHEGHAQHLLNYISGDYSA